jgi:hypothetical protein
MAIPRILVLLSALIFAVMVAAMISLNVNDLSGYGSIVQAGGSLLAVVWFSAGLWYQAKQLQEQREQFSAQFKHLQHASRRDALLAAKSILDECEKRAIATAAISSIDELAPRYMNFVELKPILESTNPEEVTRAYQAWLKKEGAALILLRGIKSAAEVYLQSAGVDGIDYTKNPEDFVFIFGPRFFHLPYFDAFHGSAHMLTEFMVRMEPARNAAQIAFFAASAKTVAKTFIKMDKIRQDIAAHVAKGYPLPEIAKDFPPP